MAVSRPLPVATSVLVGRTEQVDALRGILSASPSRLVTLTGPPGVGKTRLALEVAATMASDFADGVAWVDLGPVHDAAQVPAELARGIGVPSTRNARGTRDTNDARDAPSVDSVVTAFAGREMLLVVDNYEHLLDAASAVADLLERLPRLRVLATSRQRLHLLAEVEYPVPPLPMPVALEAEDVARLAGNPAVELLLARAPAHVTLTQRTARPLVEICLRLDGLPLAIELAAARLRVFTPSELAFRLEHRTVGLSGAPRDAPARHRTLEAAIDWSHELLPDAERTAFRRLAVLVGEWTMAAAEAVCGLSAPVALAAIESLLDQSLIQRAAGEGSARFTMLASIHDFAGEQLVGSGELGLTRDRHARYFAGIGAAWEATIGTDEENTRWAEFDAMQPDLAAAFDHLGPSVERAWLGVALAWYGHLHGSLLNGAALLDALHEIEAVPGGLDEKARAATLTAAGVIGLGRGEFTRADQDLRSAVELSEAIGDERRQAVALSFLGHVARGLGDAADAAGCYRSARIICERRGSVRGTAWSAYDLGLLAVDGEDATDRSAAEPLLREALSYFEDLSYDWAVAQSARGLATALLDRGAVDEAGQLLVRSLVLHESVGDRRGGAECLEALAHIAAVRESLTSAARLIGAAQTQRDLGATRPTEHELRRLGAVDAKVRAALGRVAADHEKHSGRTAARTAVLAWAVAVAQPKQAETATAVVLTTRQIQVADLVASGKTNRQIGRVLGISEKTAEIHVSNIMGRLGMPSRAGVAAWVAAQPPSAP
ncbi:MAG: transcriptional regulator, LuxR family [Frankiales bacterium]|nr:transcriptional regulator, LuxR family [Frankiales bacterium]